jgi:transglutaminase-like putative cysteine protease
VNSDIPLFPSDDRHRVIEETLIIEQIAGLCWGREIRDGFGDSARAEATRALERLVELGLPFLAAHGRRLFDEAEVQAFARNVGEHGLDDTFMRRVLQERARVSQFTAAMGLAREHAERGEATPERSFRLSLRRSFDFSGERGGKARRLMLVPKPDPLHEQVAVEVRETSPGTTVSPGNGYLDIRHSIETPSRVEAWVDASCSLVTHCSTPPISSTPPDHSRVQPCPDANALSLDDDGFVKVTPTIRQLAETVAGNERNPVAIARKVWAFGARSLRLPVLHYESLDPSDPLTSVLKVGWSDCALATALMVGMLRSLGIPARLLGGIFLYELSPTWHHWFEAWLEPWGWVPLDVYSWLLKGYGSFEDAGWGDYFFGALDFRAVLMRFPRSMQARMSLPPGSNYAIPRGADTCYYDLQGKLLYGERISVSA